MKSNNISRKFFHIIIGILSLVTILSTFYIVYLAQDPTYDNSLLLNQNVIPVEKESQQVANTDSSEQNINEFVNRQLNIEELFANKNKLIAFYGYDTEKIADESYQYFPLYPHESVETNGASQLPVPLFIQRNPIWRAAPYGDDASRELWENGCAIVNLAMIHSVLSEQVKEPTEILAWSGDRFYLHGQGTSWNIYEAFANDFGYRFVNYGKDFYGAMKEVMNGNPCLVSAGPGHFTTLGHMLVIRGYEPGYVYLNDSNDSLEKLYSFQAIPEQWLIEDGLNFWVYSKK